MESTCCAGSLMFWPGDPGVACPGFLPPVIRERSSSVRAACKGSMEAGHKPFWSQTNGPLMGLRLLGVLSGDIRLLHVPTHGQSNLQGSVESSPVGLEPVPKNEKCVSFSSWTTARGLCPLAPSSLVTGPAAPGRGSVTRVSLLQMLIW